MEKAFQVLDAILDGKFITIVYQPIVSLEDGHIYGYEALCRISHDDLQMNIEHMFKVADRANRAWDLEIMCRAKALEGAVHKDPEKLLFINVNPNIIYDEKFREGFTKDRLSEYGLNADNIVFEITERVAVLDNNAFLSSINHYKSQNYGIALDDIGAGYSGLNVIAVVRPNLIKLDMNLIRDIDKDETKQLLCKAMVDFGKNAGILLIAEGIETEEELKTVMKLDVDFGQGFFLGIPQKPFAGIAHEKVSLITKYHNKRYTEKIKSSVYPTIGYLAKPGYTFASDAEVEDICETLRLNPTITEFAVLDGDVATGFMTRHDVQEAFGSKCGDGPEPEKVIQKLTHNTFLSVNHSMTVEHVSRLAMQRPFAQLYHPIIVEKAKKYLGIVTIRDLLNACTRVEIDTALHSNPITGLPCNLLIEKEILTRVLGDNPYCIAYFDIDNFKAYNDAYGFSNGDLMLALIANILKESASRNEFIGHIGGDDFIVICDYYEGEAYCTTVLNRFMGEVTTLYRDEDVKNGYIVSKNRQGVTENYPLASLSIAGISNKTVQYKSIDDFSQDVLQLKKKCKRHMGNYCEVL
jgi:diguanylate cyclase (GGDEF) domain